MNTKKELSETDIISKYILPAVKKAGWHELKQIRQEVDITDGRIFVRGSKTVRGQKKRADIVLYYKPNIPIAIIEAKDNKHSLGAGMQQALNYADILDIPISFSSNGDGFLEHDKSVYSDKIETEYSLENFPSPEMLWQKYKKYKGIETRAQETISTQDYYIDSTSRKPRYYQQIAINRTVEAIAKGQDRILLVMATGTGKTYTAFQIAYRLWKSRTKKRILFLADRTALVDQTRRGDFKHFREVLTTIKKKVVTNERGDEELVSNNKRGIDTADKAYEVFLGLYQGLVATENSNYDAYKDFSPDFFDLIIIDECHRGSASENSEWRKILAYFNTANHIGLTATPKETKDVSNIEYFGEPLYTYSLKQGIDDGFLAPYKVIRVGTNVDLEGWRPSASTTDKEGKQIEDRVNNRKDFDKNIVIEERTKMVAQKVSEFLRKSDRYSKTIIFCIDIEHAERMRQAMANENPDEVIKNSKYVMRITGDEQEGKRELDNFINPEETYPVVATTSKLMTTGVDAQTCKLIVLDSNIGSMTEFKQIIGRGTRINEEYGKQFFTIMDFRNVTDLFADPDFDGDPVMVKEVAEEEEITEETIYDIDEEQPNIDPVSGEEVDFDKPEISYEEGPQIINGGAILAEPKTKVYVAGVDVSILNERVQHLDGDGKLITESLKEYTKKGILKEYKTLDDFLTKWNSAEKKNALIEELEAQGVILENLKEDVKKDLDVFDLICHVAWDMPALTRRERAEQVKKRNYFIKYGEAARAVLSALLDKYAEEGIDNIEELSVLKVSPLSEFGTPAEIIKVFGGKENYLSALHELENEIYYLAA